MKKKAGILFPISALPSNYGIGDLGSDAYYFIDQLYDIKAHIWQILPMHPLSYGNSPYQPLSSKAGDEIYISIDSLIKDGLLKKEEVIPFNQYKNHVDYIKVRGYKNKLYRIAYSRFEMNQEFIEFSNIEWVKEYALFKVFKQQNNNKMWLEWSEEYKYYMKKKSFSLIPFNDEINYQIFLQYIFIKQWKALKEYANNKDIIIIGDMPIYVGLDSVDVWTNQDNFLLEEDGTPSFVAGVPPDYFSKYGQRWGNPIYDWKYMEKDNFSFWINRLGYASNIYDIIRIDHFRAFDTYWQVPESEPTAIIGEWKEAPGYKLFDTLYNKLPNLNILAEDLGDLRKEVYDLRDHYNLLGMYIYQFHFDSKMDYNRVVVYTGTHDNDTLVGWLDLLDKEQLEIINKQLKEYKDEYTYQKIIHYCLDLPSSMVIIPIWDLLGKDNDCRFNVPGKIGTPNWEWKLASFDNTQEDFNMLKDMINTSNRG